MNVSVASDFCSCVLFFHLFYLLTELNHLMVMVEVVCTKNNFHFRCL